MKKFKLAKFLKILFILPLIAIWISLIVIVWKASRGTGIGIHGQNVPVLVVLGLPLLFVKDKNKNSYDFKKVEKKQTENGCFKAAKPLGKIKGIVLHSIKGADLKNYVDFNMELGYSADNWNKRNNTKMPHYFIGHNKDKEIIIINTLTHTYSSFLCGKGENGSFDLSPDGHLQIIVCESEENDNEYFNKAVFGAAIQHCTYLCRAFHLSPKDIVSDKESYEKGYASKYGSLDCWLNSNNKTMDDFRLAVKNRLKGK